MKVLSQRPDTRRSIVVVAATTVCFILGSLTLVSISAVAQQQSSGPSTTAPHRLLWVNFESFNGAAREEAAQLLPRVRKSLETPLEETGVATYEQLYVDLERLRRIAEQLEIFGEPAGIDLRARVEAALKEFHKKSRRAAALPEFERDIKRRLATLDRSLKVADNKLDSVSKLIRGDRHTEAYAEFGEITDPAAALAMWHDLKEGTKHPQVAAWDDRGRSLHSKWRSITLEVAKRKRSEIYGEAAFDLEQLPADIEAAAESLKSSERVQLSTGQSVTGPEAIAHFADRWSHLQLKALQANAYRWIAESNNDAFDAGLNDDAYTESAKRILTGLVAIVAADAQRATGPAAEGLYFAYLQTLPGLTTRCTLPDVDKQFGQVLASLGAKSLELAGFIQAYKAATDDPLRWRRRATAAAIREAAKQHRPQKEVIVRHCDSIHSRNSVLTKTRQNEPLARLFATAPDSLNKLERKLLEQPASFDAVLASSRMKGFAVSKLGARNLAYLPVAAEPLMNAHDDLAREIFYNGEKTAPTLEVRTALYRLRNGDVGLAGGQISRIGLIGLPTRFVTMQPDRAMVRLGPLPEVPERARKDDLLLMFVVKPAWLADRFSFVRLGESG